MESYFLKSTKYPLLWTDLCFILSKLSSQGIPFEGALVDDWKPIYCNRDTRKMVCVENAYMTSHLLAGFFTFECRIMH